MGVIMRMGSNCGIKSLILFLSVFYFNYVSANPLLLGAYQQTMSSYFLQSGMSLEDANKHSTDLSVRFSDRFLKSHSSDDSNGSFSNRGCGRFCPKESNLESTNELNTDTSPLNYILKKNGKLLVKDESGRKGAVFLSDRINELGFVGVYNHISEKYKNGILFSELLNWDELLERFGDDIVENIYYGPGSIRYAGLFVYRTKDPIDDNGNYLYFNNFYHLYDALFDNESKYFHENKYFPH